MRRGLENVQEALLECISGVKGRGKSGLSAEQEAQLQQAVAELEADGGVPAPTRSGLLEGRWRLLYTTRPGSASPIQRTFVGTDAFAVYQEILLDAEGDGGARVNNIVQFGGAGVLKVEAEAITDTRPREGFAPRKGQGFPLLGKSATYPPAAKDMRVDFQFDTAAFDLTALPFKIPYPVPFKLLGDETKGWLDITYLSPDGRFRLSRGNKGTLFVLVRDDPPTDRLLAAIMSGANDVQVSELVDAVEAEGGGEASPAQSRAIQGTWRLRWSVQAPNANALQRLAGRGARSFQVVGGAAGPGRLENRLELLPGLRVRASAACSPQGRRRTRVAIDGVFLELFGLRVPLPIKQNEPGYVDWLYLDDNLRITRGNKGSVFVHTREA
ncbi:hypothetical protein WJX81_008660 [Elliptochloris bilobata]|uniref:Plastid lipid-associated protein/fibrillin conserved domain-containing protein n=1 Tax=Elliptochloris bilobata TaxID=381761 RepID=A0AAW1SLB6_9CHLO